MTTEASRQQATHPSLRDEVHAQRRFLVGVAACAAAWIGLGLPGGSRVSWALMLSAWAVGWLLAALGPASHRGPSALLGTLAVQNLGIQLLFGVPAVLAGSVRLVARGGTAGLAWMSNALTTVVVMPLLMALVLTFAAAVVAVPVQALVRRLR